MCMLYFKQSTDLLAHMSVCVCAKKTLHSFFPTIASIFLIERKRKGTYCRPPTKQCSRKQEQEMKAAPEEHAAKDTSPESSDLKRSQDKEQQSYK